MITQAIKHWISKLFAWWPWRTFPATGSMQTVGNFKKNAPQGAVLRATTDGPQSSITSVVIGQARSEISPEADRSIIEEHAEQTMPTPPIDENAAPAPSKELPQELAPPTGDSPTFEQRLIFLRHLVKQGIVNEGFAEGKVPDQYKRP